MITETPSLLSVDENACRQFEAAWLRGQPLPIEQFLPVEDDVRSLPTLEELVLIELELAWKAWVQAGGGRSQPVRIEAYLLRFPRLNQAAILLRLLEQEYRVRHLYGDRPDSSEYRTRFPELVASGHEVEGTLPDGTGAPEELPRIPGYQILEFLGRGGMGVVYKARQTNLNRLVALKMIRVGGGTRPEEQARFRAEAEAVARLQHPHIVQIHEVGEQHGQPYFSLEFVEGRTLAERLAGTPQPSPAAAQLVERLARAMHAAHQHGIIHRDLKPANILLQKLATENTEGTEKDKKPSLVLPSVSSVPSVAEFLPKITDFGLAKRLEEQGQTQSGEILGTPSYMAPEQAQGQKQAIGPATDVYALGVILYEVLTGRPPFRAETPLSTLEQVRSLDPVPPRRLQPKVPRDLETICLKCLEKEPHRRYSTAEEFANDLRRFQAGEPIRARPTPLWERGLKWAKRRPALAALLGVSGAAALTVMVVVLVANARLQRQRDVAEEKRQESQAQRQRALAHLRKARQAVDQMLTRVGQDRLAPVPYMETVRRELLEDAVKFYQDLAEQEDSDPELRHETGLAYRRLGKIYELLGENDKAEQSFREAVALYEKLTTDFPDMPAYWHELASSHNNLGVLLSGLKRHKEAEQALRQAADLKEKLVTDFPDEPEYRLSLGINHDSLAILLAETGRPQEAKQAFQQSVEVLEKLVAEYPSAKEYRHRLANSNSNLGVFLAKNGRIPEAEKAFRRDRDIWEGQVEKSLAVPGYRARLALSCYNLGILLAENGRPEEGEKVLRQSADLSQQMTDEFPKVPYYHAQLGKTLRKLAVLAVDRKEFVEARRLLEQAIGHQRTALQADPRNPAYLVTLRHQYSGLTETLIQLQDHAEAAKAAEQLPPIFPEKWEGYLSAGWFLARCVVLVEKDNALPEDKRKELAQGHADRAVELLREAVRRGYKGIDDLTKNPQLDEDTRKLLHQVIEKAKRPAQ